MPNGLPLAEFLGTRFTPEQWAAPTWCDKWNVAGDRATSSPRGQHHRAPLLPGLVMSGFSFDRFVDKDLRTVRGGHARRGQAALRRHHHEHAHAARAEVRRAGRGDGARRRHPPFARRQGRSPGRAPRHAGRALQEDRRAAAREEAHRGTEADGDRCRLVDRRRSRDLGPGDVVDPRDGRARRRSTTAPATESRRCASA